MEASAGSPFAECTEGVARLITGQINWDRLTDFVGYGPTTSAHVLFLGMQEKATEGRINLAARSSFAPIEDLYEAHQHKLKPAGVSSPFDELGDPVKQWNAAARFALALHGDPRWFDREIWSRYWRNNLGRKNGTTFLMECFPFPAENYKSDIPGIPNWTRQEIWDFRCSVLRAYLDANPPRIVIAYGEPTKDKVVSLFFSSPSRCIWRQVQGVSKMPASVASNGTTRIAHVGFFGQGCFSQADVPGIVTALQCL